MHIITIEFATPEYDEAVALRYDVLRKPLNLEFTTEQLSEEYQDIHLAAYDHHMNLLGCMILTPVEGEGVKMRQVAVQNLVQGKGVGRKMSQHAEEMAKSMGYHRIYCHARETAVPFYEKLGYAIVGDRFSEVGIPHFKMEKIFAG